MLVVHVANRRNVDRRGRGLEAGLAVGAPPAWQTLPDTGRAAVLPGRAARICQQQPFFTLAPTQRRAAVHELTRDKQLVIADSNRAAGHPKPVARAGAVVDGGEADGGAVPAALAVRAGSQRHRIGCDGQIVDDEFASGRRALRYGRPLHQQTLRVANKRTKARG